jgi:Homeodomain-like domain
MSGRSWIVATAEQRAELRGLAGSSDREEADRGRAILLSLEGWTSDRIASAFCVQPDSVRHWRWIFGREGVAGLRARTAPGPDPAKARAALSVNPGAAAGRTPRSFSPRPRLPPVTTIVLSLRLIATGHLHLVQSGRLRPGRFAMARRKPVTKAACVTLPLD